MIEPLCPYRRPKITSFDHAEEEKYFPQMTEVTICYHALPLLTGALFSPHSQKALAYILYAPQQDSQRCKTAIV